MLWVLKRTVTLRRFFWAPKTLFKNRWVRKYQKFCLSKPMAQKPLGKPGFSLQKNFQGSLWPPGSWLWGSFSIWEGHISGSKFELKYHFSHAVNCTQLNNMALTFQTAFLKLNLFLFSFFILFFMSDCSFSPFKASVWALFFWCLTRVEFLKFVQPEPAENGLFCRVFTHGLYFILPFS